MEMPIPAPFAGTVRSVFVVPNVQVGPGTPLVQIDPTAPDEEPKADEADRPAEGGGRGRRGRARRRLDILDEIHRLVLGFDVDPADVRRMARAYAEAAPAIAGDEAGPRGGGADPPGLRRRLVPLPPPDGLRGPRRHGGRVDRRVPPDLPADLRHADARPAGPLHGPPRARRRPLRRRGNEEERRAARGAPLDLEVAAAGRAPGRAGPRDPRAAPRGRGSRGHLRLAGACVRSSTGSSPSPKDRWPALGDVARDLRYRVFDQPAFEAARRKVYAEMDEVLARVVAEPGAPEREERVRLLVDCPQPLQSLYLGRFESAPAATREAMLEVLTRRYYRFRPLENFRSVSFDGRAGALAEYAFEGVRHLVVSTWCARAATSRQALRDVAAHLAAAPSEHDVLIDVYSWRSGPLGDADAKARRS